MSDITAPKLKRLTLPASIDVSAGSARFLAGVEAEDEAGGSGIRRVLVWFDKKLSFDFGAADNIAFPDFSDDTFSDSTPNQASNAFRLSSASTPGLYTVREVVVEDLAGNRSTYSTADLQALGIGTTMSVTGGTGTGDTIAPTLQSLEMPAVIDVRPGSAHAVFSVSAADNPGGTGMASVNIFFDHTAPGTYNPLSIVSLPGVFDGDTFQDGTPNTARSTVRLDAGTASGMYQIATVWLRDQSGNVATYSAWDLEQLGIQTSLRVINVASDLVAPTLLKLALPESLDLNTEVKELAIGVSVQDNAGGSGVARMDLAFEYLNGSEWVPYRTISAEGFAGLEGNTTVRALLSPSTQPGMYRIASVRLLDVDGNVSTYSNAQLEAMGFGTRMRGFDGAGPVISMATRVDQNWIVHSVSSSAWPAGEHVPFTLTLSHDASATYIQTRITGASDGWAGGATRVDGDTGVATVSGWVTANDRGAVSINVELLTNSRADTFNYAVTAFSINGREQSFAIPARGIAQRGTGAADLIEAKPGATLIDGREGLDTVRIAGAADAFAIAKTAQGFRLERDGQRLDLQQVERLQFVDKTVALDIDGSAGQVYRLYQAAFDRKPDLAGVGYWIHQAGTGLTLLETARSFIASQEFADRYGARVGTDGFVKALYQNVLHRAPDQGGFDYWMKVLDGGMERAQALVEFSESAENVAQVVGTIANGFEYTPWA